MRRPSRARAPRPPRRGRRRRRGRARGAASSPPRGRSRAGSRCPGRRCRARSRGPARTGRGRRPPRLAEGSIPSEPVSIAASSLRMSPNRFSVTITSKSAGRETSCIAALSTSRCSSSTSACSLARRGRPSRATGARSRARWPCPPRSPGPLRPGGRVEGDLGDPLDLLDGVGAVVVGAVARRGPSRRSRCRRSARARPAGRCPRSARAAAGWRRAAPSLGRTGRRFANRPRPLRRPSSPCSGRGASGSVVSHFGPPTAQSRTASASRQAVEHLVGERGAVLVDRGAADQVLGDLDAAELVEQPAAPRRRSRGRCRRREGGRRSSVRSCRRDLGLDVEPDVVERQRLRHLCRPPRR